MRIPRPAPHHAAQAALAALAGGLVIAAGGCTPADRPILALAAPDGRPTAVLVSCGGFATVSVYADDGAPASAAVSWRVTADDSAAGVVEIPLLGGAPAGWSGSGAAGQRLQPGVRYALGGRGGEDAIPVRFTPEDLARVPADQVLAPDGDNGTRLVPRTRFEAAARAACP